MGEAKDKAVGAEHGDADAQGYEGTEVPILLPPIEDLPPALYSNYVSAIHSAWDVTLMFAQLAMPASGDEAKRLAEAGGLTVKPVARIAIPREILTPLIDVLIERRRQIETEQGGQATEIDDDDE